MMNKRIYSKSLWLLSAMFLMVGCMFCMNDILFPSLIQLFHLSFTQATAIQTSFYSVYIIFPVPVAFIVERKGYKYSIIGAVVVCAVGCAFFYPAYEWNSFVLCLVGLFTLSVGIVVMNVAANAYATKLGDPEGAERRINFIQVFSRIGYAIVPVIAMPMIHQNQAIHFDYPYVAIMCILVLIALLMISSNMPAMKGSTKEAIRIGSVFTECMQHRHLLWGFVAMFFYVGAEACIAGFFIIYLKTVMGFSDNHAATYLTFYYIMASVGGFAAIGLLRYYKAAKIIGAFAVMMTLCLSFIVLFTGSPNAIIMVAVGGLLGPMFPTLFGMAIHQLGDLTNRGAALINIAISGGAFFAPLQGMIADHYGVKTSYVVPLVCFVVIVVYAFCYSALRKNQIITAA
jgi:MFS transporter, FHS family, L-fucose permease